jgi:NAD(P)-dependent dehydrogenase (short-subunit alcohol dehydrogenase family)
MLAGSFPRKFIHEYGDGWGAAMSFKGFDLAGKVAVLTGSTSGMGLAIARGLGQCGARIVVSNNVQLETEDAARLLVAEGYEVKGACCDITSASDIERFAGVSKSAFGRVDIVICLAAGPVPVGPIAEVDIPLFERLLITTVSNNLLLVRQFLPEMAERRDGSIIMMSSIASQRANQHIGAYGAAKAAMNGVVRSIAAEWGAFNIRANALAPSIVRTNFSKPLVGDPDREKIFAAKSPANRIAEPEDIVGAAILLASPAGAYISGQTILIDGGRSII